MRRFIVGVVFVLFSLSARADFTMTLDSVNAPMSGNVSSTVGISLLGGVQSAPVVIPGTTVVPFTFHFGQSPVTLTFLGTPTGYTAIGFRTTIGMVGGLNWVTNTPLVLDVFFPTSDTVPPNTVYTLVYQAPLIGAATLISTVTPPAPPPPAPGGVPSKAGSSVCVGTAAHSIPCTSPALTQLIAQDGATWTITGLGTSASPTKVFRNGVDTKNIYPDANVLYVFQNAPGSPIEISVFSNAHGHVCWNGSWGGC